MISALNDILHGQEDNYLLPFYWQHGNHTDQIPAQVQQIYESGARALCVESRPHPDFCGDGWWRDMDVILRECKARNMKVWILDDDHFPTGHARGAVVNHPALRPTVLRSRFVDVAGPMADAALLLKPEEDDAHLLGVVAYRRLPHSEECDPATAVQLTVQRDGMVFWDIPDGVWRVFFYTVGASTGLKDYIDMIRPESVRLLIDAVYEPHWAHYAAEFGSTIAGFFSDEPSFGTDLDERNRATVHYYDQCVGREFVQMPWNETTRRMMTESLGRDPLPELFLLWHEGEGRADVRAAYMDAVTRQYRDCFTRQLADWCHAHGVEYIGHVIEDSGAHTHLGRGTGHYFRALALQDMSGIDVVLHQIMPGFPDEVHSASSASRVCDPAFFDCTLAKLGASLAHITPHMRGRAMCEIFGAYGWAEDSAFMKRLMDHMLVRGINHFVPHAFSPTYPDPDCPPHFGAGGCDPSFDAFTALMRYTNRTAHLLAGAAHVASVALLYHAEGEWASAFHQAMPVDLPAQALMNGHIDFDILPADVLADADVTGGRLRILRETYGALIVPAADHLPQSVRASLARLQALGLPVWFADGKPADCAGLTVPLADLAAQVRRAGLADIEVSGDCPSLRIYHCCRDGADIFFLVNEGRADADCILRLPCRGAFARMNLIADESASDTTADGRVPVRLVPGESQLLIFTENDFPPVAVPAQSTVVSPEFSLDLAPAAQLDAFAPYRTSCRTLFNVAGPDGDPSFSGKMRYRFRLNLTRTGRCWLDLGRVGQNAVLRVNGVDCGIRICAPYRFEITDAVRDGVNDVEVIVANTLVQQHRDSFSVWMTIAPSGLLGPVRVETL